MGKLKKVWSIITTAVVAVMVLCALFLMGSRLLGFRVFNIVSGSMEPVYSTGDLIYVKTADPQSIQVGDVITFVLNEDLVVATHRVVRIDGEKQHLYTKGDANDAEDGSPVHFNNVIGVPVFSIPGLGYVSNFIQNPPGMYLTIAAVAVLIILAFAPDIGKKKTAPVDAENARLKAELEALKAQLEQQEKSV